MGNELQKRMIAISVCALLFAAAFFGIFVGGALNSGKCPGDA